MFETNGTHNDDFRIIDEHKARVAELNACIDKLKKELSELSDKNNDLKNKNQELLSNNKALSKQLSSAQLDIEYYVGVIDGVNKMINFMRHKS